MPKDHPGGSKAFNGPIEFSGSASGVVGDVYEYGTKYNVQHHHYNYYAPSSTAPRALLTNHAHGEYTNGTGKGLALLSFDGGPFGGLSSLLVLKVFMERVARTQGLRQVPKPCEFFDMMSGAGVGGLLAILLGCLEMTVDQCIVLYLRFSKDVLSKPNPPSNDNLNTDPNCRSAIFDHMAVERFVKQILRDRRESEDRLLQAPSALSCKVFVKVVRQHEGHTEIWRSYRTQTPDDHRSKDIKLCLATQATLATSPWFHPAAINEGNRLAFYGTSTSFQNSSLQDLFTEAQMHLLDGNQVLTDHLDCLVSVGGMISADTTRVGLTGCFLGALADGYSANKAAYMEFSQSHMPITSSGQFCRLEVPLELKFDDSWLLEDHTRGALAAERYLNSSDTVDRLRLCFARLLRHQLAPGFAMMQESQHPVEVSDQSPMLPQPDQISSYNARLSHYRRSQPRVKDTCTWIFKNPTFVKWCQAPLTSVLVCTGTVGCGKSFLAAAIIDHIQELRLNAHHGCVHYFFEAGHNLPSALQELLRALIKQLVVPRNNTMIALPSGISKALHNTFRADGLPPSIEELVSLLKMLIDSSPPCLYMIDGLDDLAESQLLDMFGILRRIFANQNPHGSKLALFSRESLGRGIDIERQLTKISQVYTLRLRVAHLSRDIARFVEVQVNEQQLRRVITSNEALIMEVKRKLVSHSEKMFLWIHFQIQTIWDSRLSKNDQEIRALIENLPDGLDKTYEMCLRRIENHDDHNHRDIAVKAFRWTSAARRPLTPRQAREVVSMSQSNVELQESQILNASVIEYCANLLTTDLTNRRVQFAHASVEQFLKSRAKVPQDLLRYHLDSTDVGRECMAVCLSYLDTVKPSGQLVIGQGAEISHRIPRVIDGGLFASSKMATVVRVAKGVIGRKTPSARPAAPSRPNLDIAKLEMHNYFVENWLSHTCDIDTSHPNISIFRRLCWRVDPDLFPWLHSTATVSGVYQQLAQYSVINRHLPLLRAVRDYLKKQKPGLLSKTFESHCPGTKVRLVHMAAALGLTDVLQELSTFCDVDAYDGEHECRTPAAWAAEKLHFETVEWLVTSRKARLNNCRKELDVGMSLLTILAGLDTDTGFWSVFDRNESFFNSTTAESRSQALFAACTKGHISVAKKLINFGAERGPLRFHWPGWGVCTDGSLMDFALRCKNSRAIESLAAVHREQGDIEQAVEQILTWTASQILPVCGFLCLPEVLPALTRNRMWLEKLQDLLLHEGSDTHHWITIVRNVLHAQLRSGVVAQPELYLARIPGWTTMPDDIQVALLRLKYVQKSSYHLASDVITSEDCLLRQSSRVFLERVNFRRMVDIHGDDTMVRQEISRAHRLLLWSLGAPAVEALIYKLHLNHVTHFRGTHPFEQLPIVQALLKESGLLLHSEMRSQPWTFRMGLKYSVEELFHLARCYRTCRRNGLRAQRMYQDLKHIPDNYDLSLNFPHGYMKINGRYVVKISIVGSIYRWNYRIRRRKNLPFSAADVAYAKAVGLPIPEGSQSSADGQACA